MGSYDSGVASTSFLYTFIFLRPFSFGLAFESFGYHHHNTLVCFAIIAPGLFFCILNTNSAVLVVVVIVCSVYWCCELLRFGDVYFVFDVLFLVSRIVYFVLMRIK